MEKPKSVRQIAAEEAARLHFEEFPISIANLDRSYTKSSTALAGFFATIAKEFFYEGLPDYMQELADGHRTEIRQLSGMENADAKFAKLSQVLSDMTNPYKPVDVEALKSGLLATQALQAYSTRWMDRFKTAIDPSEARKRTDALNESLKDSILSNPLEWNAEGMQSDAVNEYYRYKHLSEGLSKIADSTQAIMHTLGLTPPQQRGGALAL